MAGCARQNPRHCRGVSGQVLVPPFPHRTSCACLSLGFRRAISRRCAPRAPASPRHSQPAWAGPRRSVCRPPRLLPFLPPSPCPVGATGADPCSLYDASAEAVRLGTGRCARPPPLPAGEKKGRPFLGRARSIHIQSAKIKLRRGRAWAKRGVSTFNSAKSNPAEAVHGPSAEYPHSIAKNQTPPRPFLGQRGGRNHRQSHRQSHGRKHSRGGAENARTKIRALRAREPANAPDAGAIQVSDRTP